MAQYRNSKGAEGVARYRPGVAHRAARVAPGGSPKGLMVDGDVEPNGLGDNFEVKDD
jgi:hypothetical protein